MTREQQPELPPAEALKAIQTLVKEADSDLPPKALETLFEAVRELCRRGLQKGR